jgi:hypothetical protein
MNMSEWSKKAREFNGDKSIELGDIVVDFFGSKGVIVKVVKSTNDFHGTIYAWQMDKLGYGADNCEHYSYDGWQDNLMILEMY